MTSWVRRRRRRVVAWFKRRERINYPSTGRWCTRSAPRHALQGRTDLPRGRPSVRLSPGGLGSPGASTYFRTARVPSRSRASLIKCPPAASDTARALCGDGPTRRQCSAGWSSLTVDGANARIDVRRQDASRRTSANGLPWSRPHEAGWSAGFGASGQARAPVAVSAATPAAARPIRRKTASAWPVTWSIL